MGMIADILRNRRQDQLERESDGVLRLPESAPMAGPTTLGRGLAGFGLDMLTPGPGAPGLAAMLAAPDEPEILASGTDPRQVEAQLHEMGVSPTNSDLMTITDNDTGETQVLRMQRSQVSDDQAREWRYQDAMEAIQLEIGKRNAKIDEDIKQLELLHSSVMQDYDRAMRLTRDPQMRALYVRAKGAAVRDFQQGLMQKQRDRDEINLMGTEVLTSYVQDRYRGASYRPTDEMADLARLKDELMRGRTEQGESLKLRRDLRLLAEKAKIGLEDLRRDTIVGSMENELATYQKIISDPRISSTRREEAQTAYDEKLRALERYVDSRFKEKAGGNGLGQGGGAAPAKPKVLFTTSNGVQIVETAAGPQMRFPKGMGEAGKRRAAAEIGKNYGR